MKPAQNNIFGEINTWSNESYVLNVTKKTSCTNTSTSFHIFFFEKPRLKKVKKQAYQ